MSNKLQKPSNLFAKTKQKKKHCLQKFNSLWKSNKLCAKTNSSLWKPNKLCAETNETFVETHQTMCINHQQSVETQQIMSRNNSPWTPNKLPCKNSVICLQKSNRLSAETQQRVCRNPTTCFLREPLAGLLLELASSIPLGLIVHHLSSALIFVVVRQNDGCAITGCGVFLQ